MARQNRSNPAGLKIPAVYCCHSDHWYIGASIRAFAKAGVPAIVYVSDRAWNGIPGNTDRTVEEVESAGGRVIRIDHGDETAHRRAAYEDCKRKGYEFILIPDSDEVPEPALIDRLLRMAAAGAADAVGVTMDTYFKSKRYVIRPREQLRPILLLDVQTTEHVYIREFKAPVRVDLGPEAGILHHLSYSGPPERIESKIATWGHKHEVLSGWWEDKWLKWDQDPGALRDFHPTHPNCYGRTERIDCPDVLADAFEALAPNEDPPVPEWWPKLSVVIPLYGGPQEIGATLRGLEGCQDLVHETIVVDDVSADDAPDVANSFDFVKLLRNRANMGFAGTSNVGYRASTGEIVLFQNSDAVITRAPLIRLVETLWSSGTIAAAGPYSDHAGYFQQLLPMPSFETARGWELFAQDFAHRQALDREVNMIVGFCMAVRRSAIEEVGPFDERFKVGMWEDADLCYRFLKARYRLMLSSRSFVRHIGGASMARQPIHSTVLLSTNKVPYLEKWKLDLETGFTPGLPGVTGDPIVFNFDRLPEKLIAEAKARAKKADITLCIIAKDEEKNIGAMIDSFAPFVNQIVVVDTGSKDKTKEIAAGKDGVDLYDYKWCDSFSAARNESLKHARGKWVIWADCDDRLEWTMGEKLLETVENAPPGDVAYTIAVQFVDRQGTGARVDHVKLFRNNVGAEFIFRIHENVLPSLKATGLRVVPTDLRVLHSGQDTSPEALARKRRLHYRLLLMDLKEWGEHTFILWNWGMTEFFNGFHEKAVGWLERSIAAGRPGDAHIRKAYALLSAALLRLGRASDAAQAARSGLNAVRDDPELHAALGNALKAMGLFEEAKEQYALMRPELLAGHFVSLDPIIFGPLREHNMAECCMGLGDYIGARGHWRRAISARPLYAESVIALCHRAAEAGDMETVRNALAEVESATGHSDLWIHLGVAYHQLLEGDPGPVNFLYSTLARAPHSHGVRRELCQRLLAQGEEQEAVGHLNFLAQQGVAYGATMMGRFALRGGRLGVAEQYLSLACGLDPQDVQAAEQLANVRQALAAQAAQ